MLRRNLDVSRGLVNGTIGNVIEVIFGAINHAMVESIVIQFEKIDETYILARLTSDYEFKKNFYVARSQFPITVAWAITIHKCQGLTLDAVMIDLGENIFEPGMAYVALSRCRTISNLFLIDLDPSKLICNQYCIFEYNRLLTKFYSSENTILQYNDLPKVIISDKSKNKRKSNDNKDEIPEKKFKEISDRNNSKKYSNVEIYDIFSNTYSQENNQIKLLNPIKFSNNGENACYSNVILQAFIYLGSHFKLRVELNFLNQETYDIIYLILKQFKQAYHLQLTSVFNSSQIRLIICILMVHNRTPLNS